MMISLVPLTTAQTVTDTQSKSALQGSLVEVISGQSYYYSVTSRSSGRYDEFYITTSGASSFTATVTGATMESNDDIDLYYRFGSQVAGCSSSTCSTYDAVSWTSGNDESITVNNPTDGTQYFRVQRYAGRGTDYYYFQIDVVSGGTGGDTTAPSVTLTAPSQGATVSGTVAVSASASDNVGVDHIEFRINGALKFTDTSSPYSFNWDTTTSSDGSATVSATAFDAAGNSASDSNTVTVDNGGSQTSDCGETPRVTGSYPWWSDVIDAEVAHSHGCYGGNSVVVILDTGLSSAYSTLFPSGSINTQYSRSYTQIGGYDNVAWNGDNTEGHGTSTTSTVLGYYVPSSWGFTNNYVMGAAPNAEVIMLRVVYWVGSGVTYANMISNWVDAINYARDLHNNNAAFSSRGMVISMSLGYDPATAPSSSNTALENALTAARNDGIAVSVSAGNDGPNPNTTGNPANFAASTSVAAAGWSSLTGSYGVSGIITDIPENDFSGLTIADFSSRGKVEVTGIGWNLVLPSYDGSYYYISGTSFSCPQISSIYAVMFGFYGGTTSPDFLETTLMNSAYNSGSMSSTTWGAGFAQLDAALGF